MTGQAASHSLLNPIRARWLEGQPAIVSWLQIPSALSAEAIARCGPDGLVIDMQHSLIDFGRAVEMIYAIEAGGGVPMVRVADTMPAGIMRLLDAGATGIIAPLVETRAQAERFAASLHFPPAGQRSFGPRRPLLKHGARYLSQASDTLVSFAMIETREGLANLDEILHVPGFDGIFIGPSDLALALGRAPKPDPDDPDVLEVIRMLRKRAHAAGKRAGIYCIGPLHARAMLEEGFDLVSVGTDLNVMVDGVVAALRQSRAGLSARVASSTAIPSRKAQP